MPKYTGSHYLIDRKEPSKLFLQARNIAGSIIESQFKKFNSGLVNSSQDGFKWIKTELTHPSFDHLTFAYKNLIFSVVIEIIQRNKSSLSTNQRDLFLKSTTTNSLIPCVSRFTIDDSKKSILDSRNNYNIVPYSNEWNLIDLLSTNSILPQKIPNDVKFKMSNWELQNFAIQVVNSKIKNDGGTVLSFCDMLEIDPQIWFKDKNGNICWVITKHVTNMEDENHLKWLGLETKSPELIPYDGFFASVQFQSNDNDNLYRGDGVSVKYEELNRIYVK
jgi:hypothetical protein